MCTRKSMTARILVLGCIWAACLGATWTWTGGNENDNDWDSCENWGDSCSELPPYPSTTNDDVTIHGFPVIALSTEEIDDLLIEGAVTFDGASAAELTVDSLLITGGTGQAAITVSGNATVEADGTN